ncbi:MAG: hypothetical protein IJQ44_00825 [Bacteroidaceae bacterium]|nr:hypothetical protein [Bacteroidaceae bacterium]
MSRENLFAMPWRENEGWNPTYRTDQLSRERTDTALSHQSSVPRNRLADATFFK